MYWTGDTADLEIGQDVEDAAEEEQAVDVRAMLDLLLQLTTLNFVLLVVSYGLVILYAPTTFSST